MPVEFVVGGGVACVLHGVERVTLDLGVAVQMNSPNLDRLICAVDRLLNFSALLIFLSGAAHPSSQLIHWFLPGVSCCDRFREYEPGEDGVTANSKSDPCGSSIAPFQTRLEFRGGRSRSRFALVQWTIASRFA